MPVPSLHGRQESSFLGCVPPNDTGNSDAVVGVILTYHGKINQLGHFPPQICIKSQSYFNLCQYVIK